MMVFDTFLLNVEFEIVLRYGCLGKVLTLHMLLMLGKF